MIFFLYIKQNWPFDCCMQCFLKLGGQTDCLADDSSASHKLHTIVQLCRCHVENFDFEDLKNDGSSSSRKEDKCPIVTSHLKYGHRSQNSQLGSVCKGHPKIVHSLFFFCFNHPLIIVASETTLMCSAGIFKCLVFSHYISRIWDIFWHSAKCLQ